MSEAVLSEHAERAARTYGAAADHYSLLDFWNRWGAATVSRLPLAAGDTVLDLCCGAGASAIPAAHAVGPTGRVLGIDVAAPLLELARLRAAREAVANAHFRWGDATGTDFASGSFDAVVCVCGVFFAADMPAFVAEMWRLVRPGGTLAITTWGPEFCEPANGVFWEAVEGIDPRLVRAFNPWDQITTPDALADLLARGGVGDADVAATAGETTELADPADFWDIVLGSGYRGTIDAVDEPRRDALRGRVTETLRVRGVTAVRTDVVYATARK